MSARQGAERLIIVANFHSKCFSLVSQAVCCASQSAPWGFMEVPKQRARCGPQHCVLGLADTDTQAEGGNYQHSLRPAVAYESYRTRSKGGGGVGGRGFTKTEWPLASHRSPGVRIGSHFSGEACRASSHSSSSRDLWWGACCARLEQRCEVRARSRRQARRYLHSRKTEKKQLWC